MLYNITRNIIHPFPDLVGGDDLAFPISAALLDACVLALLNRGDSYGYEMTQLLQERLQVSESTLYPVLRRLQSAGLLHTYDQPYQGRNRRYYSITDAGTAQLIQYREDWDTFKDQIDSLLADESNDETADEIDELIADETIQEAKGEE
jgi:PadR family transcriptional regulator PadR